MKIELQGDLVAGFNRQELGEQEMKTDKEVIGRVYREARCIGREQNGGGQTRVKEAGTR